MRVLTAYALIGIMFAVVVAGTPGGKLEQMTIRAWVAQSLFLVPLIVLSWPVMVACMPFPCGNDRPFARKPEEPQP